MKFLVVFGIAVLAVALLRNNPRPVEIGDFPGLEQLIAKSDAIVVLRVDQHVGDVMPNSTLYTTHDCYIYQTLKGEIPTNERIRLRLMDTGTAPSTPFSMFSTHLMFLTKKRAANEPTDYRTIEFQGANTRIPEIGNEKVLPGDTSSEQIRSLIISTMEHNRKQHERDQAFLKEMAK